MGQHKTLDSTPARTNFDADFLETRKARAQAPRDARLWTDRCRRSLTQENLSGVVRALVGPGPLLAAAGLRHDQHLLLLQVLLLRGRRGVFFVSVLFRVSPTGGGGQKTRSLFSRKTPPPRSKHPGVTCYACTITTPLGGFYKHCYGLVSTVDNYRSRKQNRIFQHIGRLFYRVL